jgi:hypothetical protein
MFQATQALGQRDNVQNYRAGSRGADTSFAAVSKK